MTKDDVHAFGRTLGARYGADVSLFLTSAGDLHLQHISLPTAQRGQGTGSTIMRELVRFADAQGRRITLDPALRDPRFGTTGRARLIRFYTQFGFVQNRGRHTDFRISAGMYREPRVNPKRISTKQWIAEQRLKTGARPLVGRVTHYITNPTTIKHSSGAMTIYPNPYVTLGGKRGDLLGYQSAKTVKGESLGYRTAIMYLMPHTLSGTPSLCPYSTPGCRSVCLSSSGQLGMQERQRMHKTMFFRRDPQDFIAQLLREIANFAKREHALIPCVRLNGTSDIMWERLAPALFTTFPHLQFYDYTKIPLRFRRRPPNYALCYSLAETPAHVAEARRCLETGEANVAVPFDLLPAIKGARAADPLPATFGRALFGRDYPVIDGDLHDLRFLDRPRGGAIVGLRAKGSAQQQRKTAAPHHGFIVHANPRRRVVAEQGGGGMTNTNPALMRLLYGAG